MQDEDDTFDDDDPSFGEPLHPDDRLWRHPSEMRDVPAPGSRSIPDTVDFAPAPRARAGWTIAIASGLVGASIVLLVVLATGMNDRTGGDAASNDVAVTSTVPTTSTTTPAGATEAIAAVMPSVAQLTATSGDTTVDASALVIRADGYLVTDSHALEGATAILVTLSDGTSSAAEIVAVDPVTALAVIAIERADLVPAAVGDPAELQIGQLAMVLGSHSGGGPSISSGVISAFGERSTGQTGTLLYGLIRFDAPLPEGAAGGPLITEAGVVVGITVRSESSESFGWATPIDDATQIATELIENGSARHAWLGVEGRRTAEGATVMSVTENSPAAEAGLQVDDILVSVDGAPLPSMAALVTIIRDHEPGDTVTIAYRRDGVEWTCVATLGLRG